MNMDPANHEKEPTDLEVGINIDKLTKVYKVTNEHRCKAY